MKGKPFKDEIVKGKDTKGKDFEEGRVLDRPSTSSESRIRLQDGSDTTARHEDIKGQMEQ